MAANGSIRVGDNQPRFPSEPGVEHVESWFLRANAPDSARALWLKATILSRARGAAVAEVWCSLFDGEKNRTVGAKSTVAFADAHFGSEPQGIRIADASFALGPVSGVAHGRIAERGLCWDLSWQAAGEQLGAPLCMLPSRAWIERSLPRNKLLTPFPVLRLSGAIAAGEEEWAVRDWVGMQGHNWGAAHAPEYAWGQCVFTDAAGDPFCVVEGASGRVQLGGWTTPLLSILNVRRKDRELRFNRLVDFWNWKTSIRFPQWKLRMRGPDGEALLVMTARPERMICLGYENPNGRLSYCLNSKLARVVLRVNPVNGEAFECISEHGGALEFLRPDPVPGLGQGI